MAIDEDVRALAQVPLFHGFSAEQLRLVAFGTEHMSLAKGRELYRQGETSDCGFLLLSGLVNLVVEKGKDRLVVHEAGPGTLLGELALIAPGERSTGAVAATTCDVIRISRSLFRRVLDEYPELAVRIHSDMTKKFSNFIDNVAKLESRFID